jgi:hypothetical protein
MKKIIFSELGFSLIALMGAITLLSFKAKPSVLSSILNGARDFTVSLSAPHNGRAVVTFLDEQNGQITTFDSINGTSITKKLQSSHTYTITMTLWVDPNFQDSCLFILNDDSIGLDLSMNAMQSGSVAQSGVDLKDASGLGMTMNCR